MTNWIHLDAVPPEARLMRLGLDFGYTDDPTAIIEIYEWNGGYPWDQVCYAKGMSNKDIADVILAQDEQVLVIGDSSEPKSIDEIDSCGVMIVGAVKGADSVRNGLQVVTTKQVYVTNRSTRLIKEGRNYIRKLDKNGEQLNVPRNLFNHGMDAGRYALTDLIGNEAGDFEYEPDD